MSDHNTRYEYILRIIRELETGRRISDVLEIGCKNGKFVRELRNLGYNAHGIDMSSTHLVPVGVREGYLHHLAVYQVPEHFDYNFDLMFACRVMCKEATLDWLAQDPMNRERVRITASVIPGGLQEIIGDITKGNNQSILDVAAQKLDKGGYLVATETGYDILHLDAAQIQRTGLTIVRFQPREMVLRR
jgi:SAM-dependent methyltransferase